MLSFRNHTGDARNAPMRGLAYGVGATFIPVGAPAASAQGAANQPPPQLANNTVVVDGTPVRVVVLAIAAALGLAALRAGGVRFNVGVSS